MLSGLFRETQPSQGFFGNIHRIESVESIDSIDSIDKVFDLSPPRQAFPKRNEENAGSGVFAAITAHDGSHRLHYRGYYPLEKGDGDHSLQQTANVAFSEDGKRFKRPELGIHDIDDGGANNVVWRGNQAHNLIPFLDRNPNTDADVFSFRFHRG